MKETPLLNPFLPTKRVTSVLIDRRASSDIISGLESLDIKVYLTAETNIDDSVSTHPDMQFLYLGDGKAITWDLFYDYYNTILKNTGIEIIKTKQDFTHKYPGNTALNCVICGNSIIHNFKFTNKVVLNEYANLRKINVSQSYSKCSIAVVGDNSIITEDPVIYKIALQNRFEACHLGRGDITLKGYNYGFIGGASGLIDKNKMAFTGDMKLHKSFKIIEDFLNRHNIKMEFLSKERPADTGSIIPLTEEI